MLLLKQVGFDPTMVANAHSVACNAFSRALRAVHREQGYSYKDSKPYNILVESFNDVVNKVGFSLDKRDFRLVAASEYFGMWGLHG